MHHLQRPSEWSQGYPNFMCNHFAIYNQLPGTWQPLSPDRWHILGQLLLPHHCTWVEANPRTPRLRLSFAMHGNCPGSLRQPSLTAAAGVTLDDCHNSACTLQFSIFLPWVNGFSPSKLSAVELCNGCWAGCAAIFQKFNCVFNLIFCDQQRQHWRPREKWWWWLKKRLHPEKHTK